MYIIRNFEFLFYSHVSYIVEFSRKSLIFFNKRWNKYETFRGAHSKIPSQPLSQPQMSFFISFLPYEMKHCIRKSVQEKMGKTLIQLFVSHLLVILWDETLYPKKCSRKDGNFLYIYIYGKNYSFMNGW